MKKIVINLGLDPQYPCPDWDREKSSVVDEAGDRAGYIDMNDGMNVVVWLDDDEQAREERLREALERVYQIGRGPHVAIARDALDATA